MTLKELIDRYVDLRGLKGRTAELYGYTVDRLREFLGEEPQIHHLDDLTIARYLKWRAVTKHWGRVPKPATVQKDKVMLAAVWTYAAKKRLVEQFPELPRIRVPKRLPVGKAYRSEEVATLIRRAKRRIGKVGGKPAAWWWSTLIYTAYCTGERCAALLALRWGQVDVDACRVVFLGETRKGSTRDIEREITPELAALMRPQVGKPDELVWHWDRKEKSLWTSLKLLCKQAGVPYHGFHGFRRTAASYAALAGGRAAATLLLDHADPHLQRVYVDPTICPTERTSVSVLPALDLSDDPPGRPAA